MPPTSGSVGSGCACRPTAQGPLYTHDITGTGWLQMLCAASIWILVPLAAGIVRALRSEVKSA
jgi:hypothetical protein